MKPEFCSWCDAPVKVQDSFNPMTEKAVCCRGCRDAEAQFTTYHSDEQINRRAHYRYLTKGEDDET